MNKTGIIITGQLGNRNKALAEHLEVRGFRTCLADNPKQLAELLDTGNWKLVLIDYSLPGEGAQMCARHIREYYAQSVAIIMVMHSNRLAERLRAWRWGADAVLHNPLHINEASLVAHQLSLRLLHENMPIQVSYRSAEASPRAMTGASDYGH
ncbi:response regulator [uncultured Marinobacter sp.]|uniref:response regulator n=1 Tax=uncultured Marinobacter sp. TaxID=187379 RepID=UPI00259051B5|nr:response regulator [uncultured Marinobacter sp.]